MSPPPPPMPVELDILQESPDQVHGRREILHLSFHQVSLKLHIDASPGCGGVAWPAGEVLANYLARRGNLQGSQVVELGSGTGLVGLTLALLGASVWITDQAPLLDVMARNVEFNNLSSRVSVLELNWGAPLPICLPASPDLVIAADCVYFEPAFPLLVKTLSDLASDNNAEVLFCFKKRRKADRRFFSLLKKQFEWSPIHDDPDSARYSREAISLLRLTKRNIALSRSQPAL